MKPPGHSLTASARPQGGFSLVEVLVAMVILGISVLGIAQLMLESFSNNRDALYRNQATVIAEDLLDRVRANAEVLSGSSAYDTVSVSNAAASPTSNDCSISGGCDAAATATNDVFRWSQHFLASNPKLPNGTGTAAKSAGAALCDSMTKYDVTVGWKAPGDASTSSVTMGICL